MPKRTLTIIVLVVAFFATLGIGVALGGGLTYLLLKTNTVRAAEPMIERIQTEIQIENQGVLVASVSPDGPAAAAGVRRGDVILAINGEEVNSLRELKTALNGVAEGELVKLQVQRGDEELTISVPVNVDDMGAYLGIVSCDAGGPGRMQVGPGQGTFAPPEGLSNGAVVIAVETGSPAEAAGLQVGDVVTAVNGEELGENLSLADVIGKNEAGDTVTLSIIRDGATEPVELEAVLGENPERSGQPYLGIRYGDLMRFNAGEGGKPFGPGEKQFGQMPNFLPFSGLPEGVDNALFVGNVVEGSPAAEAGLVTNSLILELDGEPTGTPEEFVAAIQAKKPGDEVTLKIISIGESEARNLTIKLGENPTQAGQAYLGITINGQLNRDGNGWHMPGFPEFEDPSPENIAPPDEDSSSG